MCSNDQVAPIGLSLSSASAAAVLVGRGAPLQMGDASAHALEQPRFVSWPRMAPLPAGEPSQEPRKGHEMRAMVHVGSRGKACRWSAIRAVGRVSAPRPRSPSPCLPLRTLASLSYCSEPSPHSPYAPNPRLTLLRTAALSVLAVLCRQHACRGSTSRRRRHLTATAGASTATARRGSVCGSVHTACRNAWSLWLGRAVGRPTDIRRVLSAGDGITDARWRRRTKVWLRGAVCS